MAPNPGDSDGAATGGRSASGPSVSRRSLLLGGASAAATALAGCSGGDVDHGWLDVGSPTDGALTDVVVAATGPHAVGEGGVVVARTDDDWSTVVEAGPAGSGNGLYGADLTDGGRRVWVAGSSGGVGTYDVVDEQVTDHSAPEGMTSSWTDVAVAGRAGSERVALTNSSGEFLLGRVTADGVQWGRPTKPTGGESAAAVDVADRTVVVADTGGGVYARRPAMGSDDANWETIGVSGVDAELADLVAVAPDLVSVAAADGTVYAYDGHRWLETDVSDGPLHGLTRRGAHGLAVGTEGAAFELADHDWSGVDTPVEATLHGCALSDGSYSDVAVGENGTILERFG